MYKLNDNKLSNIEKIKKKIKSIPYLPYPTT